MTTKQDGGATAPSTEELTRLLAVCTPGTWAGRGSRVRDENDDLIAIVDYEPDLPLIAAAPAIAAELIACRAERDALRALAGGEA